MDYKTKQIINDSVIKIISNSSNEKKLNKLKNTHLAKLHFIPTQYRVFGGLLQSMNIQFGNFIETLMTTLIENEENYDILYDYSGNKSNSFSISNKNESLIDTYITRCQTEDIDIIVEFPNLLDKLICDESNDLITFKHDIDLLFKDKKTNVIYYLEIKYNDDHDTGKFIDINRKFIKTYAYLVKELNISSKHELVPILFFFNNKKLKGNIYLPEISNIKRGDKFFKEFLTTNYKDIEAYMSNLSENEEIIEMFDKLYNSVMQL